MPVLEVIERTTIRETGPEEIAAAALASADPFELDHDCIHAYPVNAHKCKNLLDIEANYDRI